MLFEGAVGACGRVFLLPQNCVVDDLIQMILAVFAFLELGRSSLREGLAAEAAGIVFVSALIVVCQIGRQGSHLLQPSVRTQILICIQARMGEDV